MQNHNDNFATFGSPPPLENSASTYSSDLKTLQQADSNLLNRDDHYILANGDKKVFFRKKDHYVLIGKENASHALDGNAISSRLNTVFPGRAEVLRKHALGKHVVVKLRDPTTTDSVTSLLQTLDRNITFVSPLLTDKNGVTEAAILPKLIVRLRKNPDYTPHINELSATHQISLIAPLAFTDREYEFHITAEIGDVSEIFALARLLAAEEFVEWVEPALLISPTKFYTPNDPLFNDQWHLHNSGQNGGTVDADVDAPEGWDLSQGTGTVIAVYDDGVQTDHPDLSIWNNPGESGGGKESNGIDDDGNGYVDDYQGWDFGENDNTPSPATSTDNHGTAVAGVAGGKGNNSLGGSGSAVNARILPVRSASMTCTAFGNAMRYAAKYGDVVNNSWGITACESELNSAIADAVNGTIPGARRGTKGTPVLFATGNSASGWRKFTLSISSAGTYDFRWEYTKDASVSEGYDTVWLDNITWPGASATDFESDSVSSIPVGFTSGGNSQWSIVSDGVHARGATGKSVKAGTIVDSQTSYLETSRAVGSGTLTFWIWVSSEQDYDFFKFSVNGSVYFSYAPGQYGHINSVGYPASNPNTIAVGASNDGGPSGLEERSYYSQFGPEVDVVAPSSGGYQGITTTDRTGADGYVNDSHYTSTFGGTSSATPLAAGVVANILAYAPTLTATELRTNLRNGADQVGPYPYPGGRNDYYGHGRINLFESLSLLPPSTPPIVSTQEVGSIGTASATGNGNITSLGTPNPTQHGVCWSTSTNPAIAGSHTADGAVSATGEFTSVITGLSENTTYYVRAYASNSAGTSYGGEVSFTTLTPVAPTVATKPVSNVSFTTATGNGNILFLGIPSPEHHGVCWNTSGTPTTSYDCTDLGTSSATGAFSSSITGLTHSTLHYVRAYASNSGGTSYGEELSFTTDIPVAPTVTTQAVTEITASSATGNGTITTLGTPNPTQHGVCGNTTGSPVTGGTCTQQGAAMTSGAFTAALTGLNADTLYYIRAYATNIAGTSYGAETSFATALVTTWSLSITKEGLGRGTVSSVPGGINCGMDCNEVYNDSTQVILTATPESGSKFTGWAGNLDCGDGTVTMTSDMDCTAHFSKFPWPIFLPAITNKEHPQE